MTPPDPHRRRLVSVVVPTHNGSASILACLSKIVQQSYANIEVLVCDDGSSDDTVAVASTVEDPRIRILAGRASEGAAAARNRGIHEAMGEIVFFTDDDVEVSPDWIANGLRHFDDPAVAGIEGRIVYVSERFRPRYSDRVVHNPRGGQFMAANVAYRRSALEQVGLFDENVVFFEDRDLARRVRERKLGELAFASDALVFHMRERYTPRSFMREAIKVGRWLELEKHRLDEVDRLGPITFPGHLVVLFFPPLILIKLLQHGRPDRRDWLMLLLIYPRLLVERYLIWRWALRNGIFAI